MTKAEIRRIRGSIDEVDFALLLNVSPSTVWRWERRGIKPEGAAELLLELLRDHRRDTLKLLWRRAKRKLEKEVTR